MCSGSLSISTKRFLNLPDVVLSACTSEVYDLSRSRSSMRKERFSLYLNELRALHPLPI